MLLDQMYGWAEPERESSGIIRAHPPQENVA
jgi:hypothetical protein